LTSALYGD